MGERNKTQALRRTMRDLLALATMPAAWVGRTPQHIAEGLADLLVATLRAEACYVRLSVSDGGYVKAVRDHQWPEINSWVQHLDRESSGNPPSYPAGAAEVTVADGTRLRVAYSPVGLGAQDGLVVAASRRPDFPAENDWLLLSVAANQAAVAFQTARLLHEKAEAEAAVSRHKRELEDFVENANVGLHWVGPDGIILWANRAELAMLGYTAQEYIGQPIADFHADPAVIQDILGRLRRCEALVDYPARMRCKDGTLRDVLINSSAYQEGGRFIHTRCFTLDVTERKAAEREQQRLIALVQHSPDFISIAGWDQHAIFLNAAGQELVGLTGSDVPRTRILDFFPADERQRVERDIFPELLAKGSWNGEVQFHNFRSGERIPVLWNVFTIADPQTGTPAYFACVSRDVREHRRSEEALRRSEKLAATGKLAATIAHEINNPIQALSNLMALMAYRTQSDPDASALVRLADHELRRVAQITRQMLSFHRETKKPIPVSVVDAIKDAYEVLVLQKQGLAARVELRFKANAVLEGFPGELRQLFLNLLSNALEATESERGRVWVRVSQGREWNGRGRAGVRVLVADNGPGIRQDLRPTVFEPFVTAKEGEGTGLGLWVCRGVADKHHGWVRLRSSTTPGRSGSAFLVFLPTASAIESHKAAESAA